VGRRPQTDREDEEMSIVHTRIGRAVVRTLRGDPGADVELEVDGQMMRLSLGAAAELTVALRRHMPWLTGEPEFVRPAPDGVVQLRAELTVAAGEPRG